MISRKISFALALLLVVSAVAGCGGQTGNADETTTDAGTTDESTTIEETTNYLDTRERQDYDGYEFRIIAQSYDQRPNLPLSEEETGEVLNDSILRRDRATEDYLNIRIVNNPYNDREEVARIIKTTVMSDENAYDLVINSVNIGLNTNILGGHLYDLSALDKIDMSQPWWCQSVYGDFQVDGHYYFTSGCVSPFFFYMPGCIAYNQTVAERFGVTGLEQLVRDGKWTFDKLKEFTLGKAVDLDGDAQMTENDLWPLTGNPGSDLVAGFGERMILRGDNGEIIFNMGSESYVNAAQVVCDYLSQSNTAGVWTDTNITLNLFQTDRAMFFTTSMNNLITGYNALPSCREMKSDYGVLPLPKYDESQDGYFTFGNPAGPSGVAVPKTIRDPEKIGTIIDTLAYFSDQYIRYAAYDCILKGKTARIEGSDEMLDIIYKYVYFDMNSVFNFGSTWDILFKAVGNNCETYVSDLAKAESRTEKAINKFIAAVTTE